MIPKEKATVQKMLEKRWYQSKKFLAFLLLLLLLSGFVICLFYWKFDFSWPVASVLLAIIFTMGFVTLAFNDKQALIDKFTRGITLSSGQHLDDATRKIQMIFDEDGEKKDS